MTFDYLSHWIWSGSTKITDPNDSMSYYGSEPDAGPEPTVVATVVKRALEATADTFEAVDSLIEKAQVFTAVDETLDGFTLLNPVGEESSINGKEGIKGKLSRGVKKVQEFALNFLSDVLAKGFAKWMKAEDNGSWFSFVFGGRK